MGAAPRMLLRVVCALAILLGSAARPTAAAPEWQERTTEHLVLRYAAGDEAAVGWYADFVEGAYLYVSDVFDHPPRPGLVVTFYPDEASYTEINPLGGSEGVLAHATPTAREVGLALWRLGQQSEGLRRDAVRHEFAHVVLGEISEQKLTIGFQEALAQYVEQDHGQRARWAEGLRRAADAGRLLSFEDLNRQRTFLGRAGVAYPQSYSLAQFLTERYGFGHLVRLVRFLPEEGNLDAAIRRAFGRSPEELETEWRAWLPSFLDGGWARNDLDLWEMAEPRRLLAEGKYAEAREGFERAERLFADLGRSEKLEQARGYLRQSTAGLEAAELGRRGAVALERYDYDGAAALLAQSEALWGVAGDESRRQQAREGLTQARQGLAALDTLQQARASLAAWRIADASATAREAGATFAELGDAVRVEEANAVLDEIRELQIRLGLATLGGGALGLGGLGLAWGLTRRPRRPRVRYHPAGAMAVREQDWSL